MKYQRVRKIISFISSLSLVFQSFLPLTFALPVYAEDDSVIASDSAAIQDPEVTPTPTEEPAIEPTATITPEPTVSETPDPTPDVSSIPEVSVTPEATVTPEITPSPTPTEQPAQEEVQNNSPPAEETPNQPTVTTDKADYAPTDTVQVAGMFFLANTPYTSTITSEDADGYSNATNIITDETGAFFYLNPLDKVYRPNYSISVTDSTNVEVASTTFTDSDWPGCGFQCTAGDVSVTKLDLVDSVTNNPITSCTPGDSVNVKIRGTFFNNTNADRVAVVMLGDVYQGANLIQHLKTTVGSNDVDGECVSDVIPKNSTTTQDIHSFSWECGESVTIQNLILSWDTGNGTCSDFFAAPACSNRTTKCYASSSFVVSAPLVADFSANNVCQGTATSFTDKTTGGKPSYTYSWAFGDGSSSTDQNPTHLYSAPGTISTTLTVTDSSTPVLTDSQSNNVTVHAKPSVDFSASVSSCPAMTVNFTNNSSSGTYLWNFGDGSSSTDANPSHSYANSGDYTVTLTATNSNSCSDFTQKAITVSPCKATLNVIKHVINDNGGTKLASEFTLTASGTNISQTSVTGSEAGVTLTLDAGSYSVDETTVPSGYAKTVSANCSGTIAAGATKTCTITNDDIAPKLTLVKLVTNDNGGSALASGWTLVATGTGGFSGTGVQDSTLNKAVLGPNNVRANTAYTLSETGGPSGYTAGTWSCTSGLSSTAPIVTLTEGQDVTCTITNDDQPASLTVTKNLNVQYGGTLSCSDFSFKVNGGSSVPFEADCSNTISVNSGTYSVVEDAKSGYSPSYNNCTSVLIGNGGSATCTITNDDQPATLIVKKVVVNDNGGTKVAQDFSFKVNGTGSNIQFIGTESTGEVTLTLANGTYSITENSDSQYTTSYDKCSGVVIPNGGTQTCTITNNDKAASLTLVKTVVNNSGGTLTASSFPVKIDGNTAIWGSQNINAGQHTVSETTQTGYTPTSWGRDCSVEGKITLLPGESKTCTITNDDIQPKLTVTKIVVGDSRTPSDFTLKVGATTVTSGVQNGFNAGTHTVSESGNYLPDYTSAISGDCASNGVITLNPGDVKSCTITNTRKTGTLRVLKNVDLNGDGDYIDLGETGATDWQWQTRWTGDLPEYAHSGNTGDSAITVVTGNHFLAETPKTNFHQVSASCTGADISYTSGWRFNVNPGANIICTFTNARDTGTLIVKKVVVNDNGGTKTASDFKYSIDGGAEVFFEDDGQNDNKVITGSYSVTEPSVTGYVTTYDNCTNVTVSKDSSSTCTITNDDQPGTLIVKKVVVGSEADESSFSFSVNGEKALAFESDGQNDLSVAAGTYTVTEPAVEGYNTTYSNCTRLAITNGGSATCTITNEFVEPELQISKYNFAGGDKNPGDAVTYRILLKAIGSDIDGLTVKDLLPKGFTYRLGSYQVKVNGLIVPIAEPLYASPGTWTIDYLIKAGQEVELLYTADISSDQQPGLYPDAAWAIGKYQETDQILALAQSEGFVDTNFSGTSVNVVKDQTNGGTYDVENEVEGEVLGASTTLPATGASSAWLILAFVSLVYGTRLIRSANKK